jgi:hypothetical protein
VAHLAQGQPDAQRGGQRQHREKDGRENGSHESENGSGMQECKRFILGKFAVWHKTKTPSSGSTWR